MAGMSNKMKAMGKVMALSVEKVKEPAETRLTVCVEETNIDGKKQKAYKIKPCCMEGEESIFTDKAKFMAEIEKLVDATPKAESEDDEESDSMED